MKLQQAMSESFRQRFEKEDPQYSAGKVTKIESMELVEAVRYLSQVDDEGLAIVANLTRYTMTELRLIQEFAINANGGVLGEVEPEYKLIEG